jgi:DnaJ-domain-containing protein 1
MGFDPRRWQPPPRGRPITANVDALLAENEALRQEVWALRQQLERLRGQGARRVSDSPAPGLTAERVERWGQAMARHPAWSALRVGPPGGLRALVEELRRHWWNPSLTLEEELDRQSPGLGAELAAALRGPHSRGRWAVRAAFALYGPRASEWLNEEPLRVVEELAQRVERLDRRQGQERRRGTRTANHTRAGQRAPGGAPGSGGTGSRDGAGGGSRGGHRSRAGGSASGGSGASAEGERAGAHQGPGPSPSSAPADPRRREALRLLGLEPGASLQAIKRAYRRLAKAHHPDLGGHAEAFHRLEAAYRLLLEQGLAG